MRVRNEMEMLRLERSIDFRFCLVSVVSRGHSVPTFYLLRSIATLSRLVSLSLGVNLLGHNGNSQDGRMKVLIWLGPSSVCRVFGSLRFTSLPLSIRASTPLPTVPSALYTRLPLPSVVSLRREWNEGRKA